MIQSIDHSLRRRYLDRDLVSASDVLRGAVLEIGGGRAGRRGTFQPPQSQVSQWTYLDRNATRRPHVRGDASALPMKAGIFDVVVCLEMLEYVREPKDALAEMARVLKPQGVLLLSTPFVHRADAADDYWRFTEPGLRALLQGAGFDVLRWYAQGHAVAAALNVVRHVISVQRSGVKRVVAWACRPFFEAMLSADLRLAERHPTLGGFATGYLVVARRSPTASA